jgi:copper chaperone CopZ
MTCSNCAMKLESLEDTLEGVKEISASYHKLEMLIEYDETKLTEEQIVAAVKKKGYTAIAA